MDDFKRLRVGGAGCWLIAFENIAETKQQLARLKRFWQIIVGADFQSGDAVGGVGAGGEHQDWDLRRLPKVARIFEAGFAGHHHVEHEGVEEDAFALGAGLGSARRGGDPIAVLGQEARQQIAQPPVVVHHKDVRRMVRNVDACGFHRVDAYQVSRSPNTRRSTCARSSRSISASR